MCNPRWNCLHCASDFISECVSCVLSYSADVDADAGDDVEADDDSSTVQVITASTFSLY